MRRSCCTQGRKQITLLSSVCLRAYFPLQSQQVIAYCEWQHFVFLNQKKKEERRKRQLFHGSWHVLIFCSTQIVESNMFQYLLLAIVKGLEEGVGFALMRKGKVEEDLEVTIFRVVEFSTWRFVWSAILFFSQQPISTNLSRIYSHCRLQGE